MRLCLGAATKEQIITRLAALFGFVAAIALGFAMGHFALALLGQQQAGTARVAIRNAPAAEQAAPKTAPPVLWPDIFGIFEPDAPPEAPEPEARPPIAVAPHNYTLKGLFASAASSWAIVSDPAEEYLLRRGDELPGGAIVDDITEEGVWLSTVQGRQLIAFDD